jgi:hypothetical protein
MHKPPQRPAELLEDLEAIRALLGDDQATLDPAQIPLLSQVIDAPEGAATPATEQDDTKEPAVRAAFRSLAERHLDHQLRGSVEQVVQGVIDDFLPLIEAELRRRLDERAAALLQTPPQG